MNEYADTKAILRAEEERWTIPNIPSISKEERKKRAKERRLRNNEEIVYCQKCGKPTKTRDLILCYVCWNTTRKKI